jgi:DNA-binding SARP family transcriptional activator
VNAGRRADRKGTSVERELLVSSDVDHRVLELRLLGPMEARVDGVSVTISGPRRRALLVRLALSANEVVSKDRLIDDIWGENPPPTAVKSLHVHVSELREMLRVESGVSAKTDEVLVTRPPGYLLRLEREALDTWRFEQSYAAARQALEEQRHADVSALCRAARCGVVLPSLMCHRNRSPLPKSPGWTTSSWP